MIEEVLGSAIGQALGTALLSLKQPLAKPSDQAAQSVTARVNPMGAVRAFLASMAQIPAPNHHVTALAAMLRSFDGTRLMQSYAVAALTDETFNVEEALKQQTAATIRASCDIGQNDAETYSEILYDVLSDAADQFYGMTSGGEGRPYFHHARRHALAGALHDLERTATVLGHVSPGRRAQYLKYMEDYTSAAQDYYRRIKLPNLTHTRYVDLNAIFVKPSLYSSAAPTDEHSVEDGALSLESFRQGLYRAVVLGDPGAGKSTLARWLAHEAIAQDSSLFFAAIVVVRDYAADRQRQPTSIVDFLQEQSRSLLQVPVPDGAIDYLLTAARAVVLFDGLDETLQVARREQVVQAVHAFAYRYPRVSVLVTSRKVGYLQAPLDPDVFDTFELGPLADESIHQYAHKWFRLDEVTSSTKAAHRADSFLAELEDVPDLRSNALMLSLLASLYVGGGYIPRNRAEVYERCSDLLFMLWDRSRGIDVPPFTWDIKQALYYIAHWMYTSEELESGVPRTIIQRTLRNYLLDRRYADQDHADEAASEFLDLWRGRAWVLTDVGTTDRQEIYQFSHHTFLEYYTAMHLARIHPAPNALWDALRDRVFQQEWTVVSQIAVQLLNRHVDRANDEYLQLVLDEWARLEPATQERRLIIAYAARLAEGLGPRPEILRRLVRMALEGWLEEVQASVVQRQGGGKDSSIVRGALQQVLDVHEPMRSAVSEALRRACRELISRSLRSDRATTQGYELRELLFVLVAAADVIAPPLRPRTEMEAQKWRDEAQVELQEWREAFGLSFITENPANVVAALRLGILEDQFAGESLGIAFAFQGIDHLLLVKEALPSPAGAITAACLLGWEDPRWPPSSHLIAATASALRTSLERETSLRQGEHAISTIFPVEVLTGPANPSSLCAPDEYFITCVTLLACRAAAAWDPEGRPWLSHIPEPYRVLADPSQELREQELDSLVASLSAHDSALVRRLAAGELTIFH